MAIAVASFAQPAKVPVFVDALADDRVGKRLAYEVREGVRRSSSLSLTDIEDDAMYTLRLVTIDPEDPPRGNSTVYSLVLTMRQREELMTIDAYIDNNVGVCGAQRVGSYAAGMVADLDEVAVRHRAVLRRLRPQ